MPIKTEYIDFLKELKHTSCVIDLVNDIKSNMICLRHDVDHNLELAHEIALIEYKAGFKSSFFFLPTAKYFKSSYLIRTIQEIQSYGHEIGIHFNGMAELLGGNVSNIEAAYKKLNLYFKKNKININGISCHGDQLCYTHQISNHWYFEDNKSFYLHKKNYLAEGPMTN